MKGASACSIAVAGSWVRLRLLGSTMAYEGGDEACGALVS